MRRVEVMVRWGVVEVRRRAAKGYVFWESKWVRQRSAGHRWRAGEVGLKQQMDSPIGSSTMFWRLFAVWQLHSRSGSRGRKGRDRTLRPHSAAEMLSTALASIQFRALYFPLL